MEGNEELLKNPVWGKLLALFEEQNREIEKLKAEVKRLKGHPGKPVIKPSILEKPRKGNAATDSETDKDKSNRKDSKKPDLKIDREEKIKAKDVPPGAVFKGYKKVIIQDIDIKPQNTLYLLETYRTPGGKYIYGQLPVALQCGDFGTKLKSYILYQYHHCHVTQPLLHEQLKEFGINISTGQISQILTGDNGIFYKEQEDILATALQEAPYIQCDDTGSRHQGKNGYCTFIGNNIFSYFKSTESKSRINFLELLRGVHTDYYVNEDALAYMKAHKLPPKDIHSLVLSDKNVFANKVELDKCLNELNITLPYAIRIVTEGALIGSILMHGINKNLAVLSDDAGQFNILLHALCWVHAERNIQKLLCYTPGQEKELEKILSGFWQLYQDLKAYQQSPDEKKIKALETAFDTICQFKTNWLALEQALNKLATNKNELLLVLKRPEIPLHNNASERDIREFVKRRKISGSTRSEAGRKSRDAFTSLKKTCRKLKISFWDFLNDRISLTNVIESLSIIIHQKYDYRSTT